MWTRIINLLVHRTYEDGIDSISKHRQIKFGRRESHNRNNTTTNSKTFEARNSVIYTAVPSEMIIQQEQLSGVFPWSQHRGYDKQICHVEIR